jgi:hypothetical protein
VDVFPSVAIISLSLRQRSPLIYCSTATCIIKFAEEAKLSLRHFRSFILLLPVGMRDCIRAICYYVVANADFGMDCQYNLNDGGGAK